MTKIQTLKSCISKYQAKRKKVQLLMEANKSDFEELAGKRKSANKRYEEQISKIDEHIENLKEISKLFE